MSKNTSSRALLALRIALGWLFVYAGISHISNPSWSAAGYLSGAKTFPVFYHWLASASNIGWVNFLNEWGLTLVGIALITGIMLRLASYAGILIMALYYLVILNFPYVGDHSFLVDEHIIYILVLCTIASSSSKRLVSLERE